MKLLKRVTKTANSRGNESRIAKQDSKNFPRIVETANGKLGNGEGCLYFPFKANEYSLGTFRTNIRIFSIFASALNIQVTKGVNKSSIWLFTWSVGGYINLQLTSNLEGAPYNNLAQGPSMPYGHNETVR